MPSSSPLRGHQTKLTQVELPIPSTSAVPYESSSDLVADRLSRLALPNDHSREIDQDDGAKEEQLYDEDVPMSIGLPGQSLAARRMRTTASGKTSRRPAISRRRPSRGKTDEEGNEVESPSSKLCPRDSSLCDPSCSLARSPIHLQPIDLSNSRDARTLSTQSSDSNSTTRFGCWKNGTASDLCSASASPITPTAATFTGLLDAVTPQARPQRKLQAQKAPPLPDPASEHRSKELDSTPQGKMTMAPPGSPSPRQKTNMRMEMPPATKLTSTPRGATSPAARKDYAPSLPSPLSSSYVSDSDSIGPWVSYVDHVNRSPLSQARSHFPFPTSTPEPHLLSQNQIQNRSTRSGSHARSISFSSASSTNAISAPTSPFSTYSSPFHDGDSVMSQSPPQSSVPRRLQSMPSPPAPQPDQVGMIDDITGTRSPNSFEHAFSIGSSLISASHRRQAVDSQVSGSSRSTSRSRGEAGGAVSNPPLTPPDSKSNSNASARHSLMTTADAWHDVLGETSAVNLGYANMDYHAPNGLGSGGGAGSAGSGQATTALMSLDGDTPAARRQSMPLGSATGHMPQYQNQAQAMTMSRSGTPTDGGNKRVNNCDLMAGSGGGHFGPATREKLASAISRGIATLPLSADDEIVHLVEYGAMHSRSASLFPAVISQLALRHVKLRQEAGWTLVDDDELSFQITHADKLDADFRPLAHSLETSSDSYLNAHWLTDHRPSLENRVFSSYVTRPFGSKVLPRNSVTFGFSAMALHWLSTDRKYRMAPATIAHGELMAFLSARATEFKVGGLFAMAYIARSEDKSAGLNRGPSAPTARPGLTAISSSPDKVHTITEAASTNPLPSPDLANSMARPSLRERSASTPAVTLAKKDIFSLFTTVLGKAIQRLVSTQLLKPAVARQLLALPIHPRTPRQTQAVLRSMQHAWEVESDELIKLSHPAWAGLEHHTVSPASYADQTIQLIKTFWETEMRAILRDALLSRAASEFTLDCLWNVVKEKLDEEGPQPLELEVQITLLRRKPSL